MKTTLALAALLAGTALSAMAAEVSTPNQAGTIIVRGRIIHMHPRETSSANFTNIGGHVMAGNDTVPEVDASYFFTPHIAAELIAATTQHTITAQGTSLGGVNVGSVRLLPPVLTAQYHFDGFTCPLTGAHVDPYVGAGVNYTKFYDAKRGQFNSVKYTDSFGPAAQVGADWQLPNSRWVVNADVKYAKVHTTATINDTVKAKVNLNPIVAGIGFGYRF